MVVASVVFLTVFRQVGRRTGSVVVRARQA